MVVAGVAVAIAVGFAFYTSQSQDVTVSGLESQAGPTLTDSWLVNRQNAVNTARDEAAAYETARMTAMGESYAASEAAQLDGVTDSWLIPLEASQVAAREAANAAETARLTGLAEFYAVSQPVYPGTSAEIVAQALAGQAQAQIESRSEAFAVVELLGTDRVTQASIDRLTGLANATVGFQAEALRELTDHFMVAEIKGSQRQSGNGVNPKFDHELEPVQDSGTSGSGDPITLPVR
jgi:hypothetical protein